LKHDVTREMQDAVADVQKLQYFDNSAAKPSRFPIKMGGYTEFLRTGRVVRPADTWVDAEKRYLSYEEVAEMTGRKLVAAGEKTHERLNGFHKAIQFPKLVFHRTLANRPHLGYCHVTASHSKFAEYDNVKWAFYIANFVAEIGTDQSFFADVKLNLSRMYFAVAVNADSTENRLVINRNIRGNGVLFRTQDPKEAFRNVLLLGAKHDALRKVIRSIQ
jgi:hypothetical protein